MVGGALAPGLLIAAPPLGDPNFERTVILLAQHNDRGALGFVVNRPAKLALGPLLAVAGFEVAGRRGRGRAFVGGPVEPESGWIIARDEGAFEGVSHSIEVGEKIRVSPSREAFAKLARDIEADDATRDQRAKDVVIALGYSGWGPGQLEREISQGAWLPIRLDEGVVFDVEPDQRWYAAHALLGITPFAGMGMRSVGEA